MLVLLGNRGKATAEAEKTIEEYEHNVLNGDYNSTFVKSGRTIHMFFDGNQSFRWSFLSPSASRKCYPPPLSLRDM